ncbi:hypothetical protein J3S90_01100 [Flavobacterium sp. P4023]|uniref:DUF3592 domain-containing protein n=1 Tax=Flavobacterium flabelliforme TaxID=2816119 RepID=A0ABS5CP52_9FLAO|nr:hypothetical protein [Flavobacterium flabelliforme]MBP4140397.1 hypothetical protein [Flavobacterium flabelliforme]
MKLKTKAILVLSPLIFIFVFAYIRTHKFEKEFKNNGKITIGRIDSIFTPPKWASTVYLFYYVGNKKHTSFESDTKYKATKRDIGKFYEIKYLPDSPEIIRVDYSKKITDTTAILKAGFSRIEIGNLKGN